MVRRKRARGRTRRPGATAGLGLAAAGTVAGLLARRHLGGLDPVAPDAAAAPVDADVVIPARDEAAAIAGCVAALWGQARGRLIVVDDGSSDGTGEIAAAAGAEVIRLRGPRPGWLGKPHACAAGAAAGTAAWIVFVDADVTLAPGALAGLVAHADGGGLDAVSPLLRQRCTGAADSLIVPLAFWEYTVGLPGGAQAAGRGILNGQCIVVRRAAYRRSGGHADPAVRGSVVEDSALARRLLAGGARIALVRGEELGEVAMYRSAAELRAGFGKNASAFLAADPGRGLLTAGAGMVLSACLPLAAAAARRPTPGRLLGGLAAWTPPALALAPRYRAARLPGWLALAHPLAATAMQLIAVEGLVRGALGRPPEWKGRRAAVD